MPVRRITVIALLTLISLTMVCFAASKRWYCTNCGSRLEYATPVDGVSSRDEQAAGPCYTITGQHTVHNWRPY